MEFLRLYNRRAYRQKSLGTHGIAVDRRFNPDRLEWPFYGSVGAHLSLLFPFAVRSFLSICPHTELAAAYKDNDSDDDSDYDDDGNEDNDSEDNEDKETGTDAETETETESTPRTPTKSQRTTAPRKHMRSDDTHLAPDIIVYFAAVKSERKDARNMDFRERARSGLVTLDHRLSLGMILVEIKRDSEVEDLKGDIDTWYARCAKFVLQAENQAYEQVQLFYATYPNAKHLVVMAVGGMVFRWTVFFQNLTQPASPYKDKTWVPTSYRDHKIKKSNVPREAVRQLNM